MSTVDCAASRPAPVPNHYSTPEFDHTGTIVTGWTIRAGEQPADFVNPCPSMDYKLVTTGMIPSTVPFCVAEPLTDPHYWAQPYWNLQHTHVVGWIIKAGEAPLDYVNPCVVHTAVALYP